jgi:hypothetical protein
VPPLSLASNSHHGANDLGCAADSETLTEVLIVFGVAVLFVIPLIGLLYVLSQRSMLEEDG